MMNVCVCVCVCGGGGDEWEKSVNRRGPDGGMKGEG